MKLQHLAAAVLILICLLLSACATEATPTHTSTVTTAPTTAPAPTITSTPDPCAPENIASEAENVNRLMREFDDASLLASNTPISQLSLNIADLQRIRRDAEDLPVPDCLIPLKQYKLAHMNTVTSTMLGFLSGSDSETLNQNITLARQRHDQDTLELARLLGITVVPAPTAIPTDATQAAETSPTQAEPFITNPGPTNVNFRAKPDLVGDSLDILAVGANATVTGRKEDALWFQVKFPDESGQTAWVYASLVKLSDPGADIPVVTPTP